MADYLEDLLGLLDETRVEDRRGQLNMTKMTRALRHVLSTGFALELPVDRAQSGIVETFLAWLGPSLVHGLRILDVRHTHVLDLLRRQDTKLDLLDRLERRTRVREVQVRHLDSKFGESY